MSSLKEVEECAWSFPLSLVSVVILSPSCSVTGMSSNPLLFSGPSIPLIAAPVFGS